jgi:hypothetical protein
MSGEGGNTFTEPERDVHQPSGERVDGYERTPHRNRVFLPFVAFGFSFVVEIHPLGFLGS